MAIRIWSNSRMSEIASQRPSRIVVDLDAIGHNLQAIRTRVGVPVMAIVKANAYGHGLVPVALRGRLLPPRVPFPPEI